MVLRSYCSIRIAVGALIIHKRQGETLEKLFIKRRDTATMLISQIKKTVIINPCVEEECLCDNHRQVK